jgi:hypothetical protein
LHSRTVHTLPEVVAKENDPLTTPPVGSITLAFVNHLRAFAFFFTEHSLLLSSFVPYLTLLIDSDRAPSFIVRSLHYVVNRLLLPYILRYYVPYLTLLIDSYYLLPYVITFLTLRC